MRRMEIDMKLWKIGRTVFVGVMMAGSLAAGPVSAAEILEPEAEKGEEIVKPEPMPEIRTLRGLAPVSLVDSGLLDYLSPQLVHDTGLVVVWGKAGETLALELAKACGSCEENKTEMVNLLLAETSAAEGLDMALGRQEVMSDFLVLVGPAFDPAQAQGLEIDEAMQAMASKRVPFASRGDGSAIHKREQALWRSIDRDVRDGKNSYVEVGQGMIPTLNVAAAMQAYTLTDTGSFLLWSASSATPLTVMVKNAPQLERKWSLVALDPKNCPANTPETVASLTQDIQTVAAWWQKPSTQKRIADYTREDRPMFRPALSTSEPEALEAPKPAPKAKKK